MSNDQRKRLPAPASVNQGVAISTLDTPIHRRVKLAGLRRCDVPALVLYTGVCVYLCGCVPRKRIQSLSRPTTPCRLPSVQSMMMPAQLRQITIILAH